MQLRKLEKTTMKKVLKSLTIRSQLMLLLIMVSAISGIVLLYVGYDSGQEAIRQSVFEKMTAVRTAKKYQIETYFRELGEVAEMVAETDNITNAISEFKTIFAALQLSETGSSCENLEPFYENFAANLSRSLDQDKRASDYLPQSTAACVLQQAYLPMEGGPVPDTSEAVTAYREAHDRHHFFLEESLERFGFEDAFLIDLQTGDILYTVLKEPDFAVNIYDGPYQSSNLATLVRQIQRNLDRQEANFIDFQIYQPSQGEPAAFVGVPINRGAANLGALVFQISIREINRIMTNDRNWAADTYGRSGETFLVGDDFLTRSDPRQFIQDTALFVRELTKNGDANISADQMYRLGTTVLSHKAQSPAVEAALAGESGTRFVQDFRHRNILSSYAPLQLRGLNWVILAETDESEAQFLIRNFRRRMLTTLVIILLISSFLAMRVSGRFVRPIEHLKKELEKFRGGNFSSRIEVESKDEIGALGESFNYLAAEIEEQQALITKQSHENERILEMFLPPDMVHRLQAGETLIADTYPDTVMITIELVEFDEASVMMPPQEVARIMNDLLGTMGELRGKHQILKIRTVGADYLAVCGMFTPRLDAARRMFDFAVDMRHLAAQFSAKHKIELNFVYTIHMGEVAAGILGQTHYSFDIWGKTMNELNAITGRTPPNKIVITQPVYEKLKDFHQFKPSSLEIDGVPQLWQYVDMVKPSPNGSAKIELAKV